MWRSVSGNSYVLQGENTIVVTFTGSQTFVVNSNEYISIDNNDYIGWYNSGTDIIRYDASGNKNNYLENFGSPVSVGATMPFTNKVADRDYALLVQLESSPVSITNLDASISFFKGSIFTLSSVYNVTFSSTNSPLFSIQSISPNPDFTIDASSGEITAVNTITSANTYTIDVRGEDGCGERDDKTLTIEIINRAPILHSLPDVYQISESAVDETLLHTVNVTDADGDDITCTLSSSPSGPFISKFISLNGALTNGVYLKANPGLNYNTASTYQLTVTCIDTSSYSVSGILYIYIIANNVPVITNLQNTTGIYSNMSTSASVFNILTTDVEGDQLSFTLTCITVISQCPFSIYSDGSILLTTSLIGSTINAYEVDVSVADVFSSSGTHRLTIYILDLNKAPLLTNLPDSIQVREDTATGTTIFSVLFYDDNGDTSISYSALFSPSSSAALFSIDVTSGQVKVVDNLNFLTQPNNYTLTIQASDGQASSGTSTLLIEIVDVNQAPVLYQTNYKIEAPEGLAGTEFPAPGYSVIDADADTLTYSLNGVSETAGFNFNSTDGSVSFSIEHDVDDDTGLSTYVWPVVISDPEGLSVTATLTVSIVDINDNVPYLSSQAYTGSVASDALVGTSVLTVSSTDADKSSEFRELDYSIQGTTLFAIDNSGVIRVFDVLTSKVGTSESMSIRVRNPSSSSYDSADVNIYIYAPSSGDYFDEPANVTWVTLTCVLLALTAAGAAYLTYKYWPSEVTAFKPPKQVAPYETKMPSEPISSRPVSTISIKSPPYTPATPSDIRIIGNEWQAWNNHEPDYWHP